MDCYGMQVNPLWDHSLWFFPHCQVHITNQYGLTVKCSNRRPASMHYQDSHPLEPAILGDGELLF